MIMTQQHFITKSFIQPENTKRRMFQHSKINLDVQLKTNGKSTIKKVSKLNLEKQLILEKATIKIM